MGDSTNPTAWAFFEMEELPAPPSEATSDKPIPTLAESFFDLGSDPGAPQLATSGGADFFDLGAATADPAGAADAGALAFEDEVWDEEEAAADQARDEEQSWFDQSAGADTLAETTAFFDAGFEATEPELAEAPEPELEPQSITEVPDEISRDDLRRASDSYTTASHFDAGMTYTMNNLFHH